MADPIKAAKNIFEQFLSKVDPSVTHIESTTASDSARMARIGRKGGKIGGKRSLETMSKGERKKRARKAARARWKKSNGQS